MYLPYSLNLLQTNGSYFSQIALARFQYEWVNLDVNEVCLKEEQDIPNTSKKSRKSQTITEWCRCGKYSAMHKNVEYLSSSKVEALEYFQLLDMRYDDRNVVTKRVSTIVL